MAIGEADCSGFYSRSERPIAYRIREAARNRHTRFTDNALPGRGNKNLNLLTLYPIYEIITKCLLFDSRTSDCSARLELRQLNDRSSWRLPPYALALCVLTEWNIVPVQPM